MKHPLIILISIFIASFPLRAAKVIDWDGIHHWVGDGDSRAALVIHYQDMTASPVWGYRWDGGDLTAEQMLREIARDGEDLNILIQYTGDMGYTLCGIGYSRYKKAEGYVTFDFDGAIEDDRISFGWFEPNTGMGQTSAPGIDTSDIARAAVEDGWFQGVIIHPFNAEAYGYAAYDYDHWICPETQNQKDIHWESGWYDGYWSFWIGGPDLSRLSFSGSGITATSVNDGNVIAFNFKRSDPDNPFGDISSNDWGELDYLHDFDAAGVETTSAEPSGKTTRILTLSGIEVGDDPTRLPAGVYIMVDESGKATKTLIR